MDFHDIYQFLDHADRIITLVDWEFINSNDSTFKEFACTYYDILAEITTDELIEIRNKNLQMSSADLT